MRTPFVVLLSAVILAAAGTTAADSWITIQKPAGVVKVMTEADLRDAMRQTKAGGFYKLGKHRGVRAAIFTPWSMVAAASADAARRHQALSSPPERIADGTIGLEVWPDDPQDKFDYVHTIDSVVFDDGSGAWVQPLWSRSEGRGVVVDNGPIKDFAVVQGAVLGFPASVLDRPGRFVVALGDGSERSFTTSADFLRGVR
jgi:hypothetical protein